MSDMRAVVIERHGGPEVLSVTSRPSPEPGPGQLLVDVEAAGVNYMDIYQRQGLPPYGGDLPVVPGAEGAGTVAATGDGVTEAAVGDRVAWAGVPGSYAERALVPAERAVPVPDGVDTRVAAAVMLQGATAHYLCNDTYPVAEGDVVVVHAAAGGVGRLLTQLAKRRGGVVVATTSTQEKAELARRAGADRLAGYDDFRAVTREVSGGTGAAAVYDGVGAATFDQSLDALRPRGYMVLYGASSGPVPPFDLQRLAAGGSLFITRPTLGHYLATREELLRRTGELFSWIQRGELDVRIGATYRLQDAARAQEDLGSRRTTGKLLLLPR
jgi:NADPH2:quinone reductase